MFYSVLSDQKATNLFLDGFQPWKSSASRLLDGAEEEPAPFQKCITQPRQPARWRASPAEDNAGDLSAHQHKHLSGFLHNYRRCDRDQVLTTCQKRSACHRTQTREIKRHAVNMTCRENLTKTSFAWKQSKQGQMGRRQILVLFFHRISLA